MKKISILAHRFSIRLAQEAMERSRPSSGKCEEICNSLKSMRHSVERIKELAGEDSDEYKSVKKTLDENEERARKAGCTC